MSDDADDIEAAGEIEQAGDTAEAPPPGRRPRRMLGCLIVVPLLVLASLWFLREDLANRLITGQLEKYDIPADYRIESVAANRQVLTNVVIGDPAHPDMTIERVEIQLSPRWAILSPAVNLRVVRPRLYGSYRQGKFSFGALDKFLFAPSTQKFRLPDWDLAIEDGRGLVQSDFGPVGLSVTGKGALRGGFAGELAAVAPELSIKDCTGKQASLYGKLRIANEQPRLTGPLRLASLNCPAAKLSLRQAALAIDGKLDADLAGGQAALRLESGAIVWDGRKLQRADGTGKLSLRSGTLSSDYRFTAHGIAADGLEARRLTIDGRMRGPTSLAKFEAEGQIEGAGISPDRDLDATLARAVKAAEGTLAAPALAQFRRALAAEGRSSTLSADFLLRRSDTATNLVVPRVRLVGTSGQSLAAISRFQLTMPDAGNPSLSGHVATGGPGMPRLSGEFRRDGAGGTEAKLVLADYAAGSSRIALPQLRLVQDRSGAIRFSGNARLSGALPGGAIRGLVLPLAGTWSSRNGLAALPGCTTLGFEQLELGTLSLARQTLRICALPGRALWQGGRLAGTSPGLNIAGQIDTSPLRVRTGPVRLGLSGLLETRDVEVETGLMQDPSRFRFATLTARTKGVLGGHLGGIEARLAQVPLDVLAGEAEWSFTQRLLRLDQAAFRVEDRMADDRFQPLIARDATLLVEGNQLKADALLREPESDRVVLRAAITHDLGPGKGSADLFVDGITFDKGLQPDTLSRRALGVIANAEGSVRGTGRIDWSAAGVTSTGSFTTDGLDFAAAFGPVKGTSGTVEFVDLLGLVTAPDQTLHIAAINPGIEVEGGDVVFEMHPDSVLLVKGAKWPFLDGTLELLPVRMVLGASEVRRYELLVDGANSAKFVQQLELANISATGTFDGRMPLVFDHQGGRIVDGYLQSRPPGGNVSYVGALSYKDLGAMANFAFEALKSLDYKTMRIDMEGSLEGEIVTRVKFDGVKQGAGAKRNFITKQLAKLPIQFNVNIRAPFFQLMHSFRSLYDGDAVTDPRLLGLMGPDGKPLPPEDPKPREGDPPGVQPPESEKVP